MLLEWAAPDSSRRSGTWHIEFGHNNSATVTFTVDG
jgi:hypothetical protein